MDCEKFGRMIMVDRKSTVLSEPRPSGSDASSVERGPLRASGPQSYPVALVSDRSRSVLNACPSCGQDGRAPQRKTQSKDTLPDGRGSDLCRPASSTYSNKPLPHGRVLLSADWSNRMAVGRWLCSVVRGDQTHGGVRVRVGDARDPRGRRKFARDSQFHCHTR